MSDKSTSRRAFIANSAKAGMLITAGSFAGNSLLAAATSLKNTEAPGFSLYDTGFSQSPLGYDYAALEPNIDAKTMEIHYTKHAGTYATNLKEAAAAEKVDMSKPLETVLAGISKYSMKMRNNGGGHYNHELFWKSMKPKASGKPSGALLTAIEKSFTSFDSFKTQFGEAAKTRFGSGWAWLYADNSKALKIGSTPNQDNPLMDVSDVKGFPLLGLDVWEHAYYLKYQNRRPEYIESWWKVVDWDFVSKRFAGI
jgi:Fe-Mn family superoxide dismutase